MVKKVFRLSIAFFLGVTTTILYYNSESFDQIFAKDRTEENRAVSGEKLTRQKKADIERLMTITNAADLGRQMSEALTQQMWDRAIAVAPNLSRKHFSMLSEEVNRVMKEQMAVDGGLLDMIIPIYGKYFAHEDIKGLIAFYKTELGQKTIATLPQVFQESLRIGQIWGQSLAPIVEQRVIDRFRDEGIELASKV